MEEKQLDFNQPLLSVRRFSPAVGSEKNVKRKTNNSLSGVPLLPSYRSDLKSGPVSNPGTVPFTWEQSPGRPKDESKSQTQVPDLPPVIPKLPPGRVVEVKHQEDLSVHRHEAGKAPSSSLSVSSVEENVLKFESSKGGIQEDGSESGDGDEAYLDALDTLSRTESFFLNCSLSGLSGLDGPVVNPSGTFSTDPQTRDFMMGRFLPAAKAMTSETPQYASWKQPVVKEPPRQLREVISGDKRPPLYRSRPNILPNYFEENKEEESDDDDDHYDEPGNLSTKICGLLPRFCLKSSLCLLNPVPGMSVRTRLPMSPASRTQGSSSSTSSCQETKNEHMRVANNEQRSIGRPQKTEQRQYNNVVGNKYDQVPHQSWHQKLEGSSLYKRLHGSSIPPQHYDFPQSISYGQKGYLDIPKEAKIDEINNFGSQKRPPTTFRDLLADQINEGEMDSANPTVEKTLHVDSVHKLVSLELNSLSSDVKGLPNSIHSDLEIVAQVKGSKETPSVESLLQDAENKTVRNEEVIFKPKSSNPVDYIPLSFSDKSDQETVMDLPKGFGQGQDICQESIASANKKLSSNEYLDYEDQQQLMKVDVGNFQVIDSQYPVAPPLPKSPSESWLWRTLPSMSTRNQYSRSYLGTSMNSGHQASKLPPRDPQWEIMIKTKKMQQPHLRFKEELITAASKT